MPVPLVAASATTGLGGERTLVGSNALQIPMKLALKFFPFAIVEKLPQIFVRLLRVPV